MRAGSGWRAALALAVFCLAASSWAATATRAGAQTTEEDPSSQAMVDLLAWGQAASESLWRFNPTSQTITGVDLVEQTPATASSPAVIVVRLAAALADADLRARLYAPVTTRAGLLASSSDSPLTPLVAGWTIEDARTVATDNQGVLVSVPIHLPHEATNGTAGTAAGGPLPLHLELVDASGAVVGRLPTFLTAADDATAAGSSRELAVAVVLDLRLPPAHLADGSAAMDGAELDRVLSLAEVLIERDGVPVTIAISPETLDALALVGDDSSAAVLRTALLHRQLLATTWTGLDIDGWTRAGRADVVLDGLRRSAEALRWIGVQASTVMRSDYPLTARALTAVTDPSTGVSAFIADAPPVGFGPFPPVTLVADSSGGSHLLAQADPLLASWLQSPDPELGVQWVRAELLRIAAAGTPRAVVMSVRAFVEPSLLGWAEFSTSRGAPLELENGDSVPLQIFIAERGMSWFSNLAGVEPATVALLLDGIAAHAALRPATVDEVLALEPPVGAVTVALADPPSNPRDFGLYLARRAQVEQRLHAYESFLGDDPSLPAPLRALLAVSASQHLTAGQRTGFLDAVDRQATRGTSGVDFAARGPVTITERTADLPVTLVNNRPDAVIVALELASVGVDFPDGQRLVFRLEPGRNDLSIPVEATAPGPALIAVAVTTPDEAGAITLSAGTLRVRYARGEGLGTLILMFSAAALAAWWLRTWRGHSHSGGGTGATVAATGSGTRAGADRRGGRRQSSISDHTRM